MTPPNREPAGGLLNSRQRCPHCGARLVLDLGLEADDTAPLAAEHTCWTCGYSHTDLRGTP
jgi:hypothetical protein